MFDPSRPPSTPIPAATIILVRDRGADFEVYLVKRHRASGFMAGAFVFPGGKVDPDDGGPEVAAIRETFEEAGVLLAAPTLTDDVRAAARTRLLDRATTIPTLIAEHGLALRRDLLHPWARWITPSVEPKRFDARFFVAELPEGQTPSFDARETVEERWLTPGEAVAAHAADELKLPPPQLRILSEMIGLRGRASLVEAARARRADLPILPRFAQMGAAMALLLPWDPEYPTAGIGEASALPDDAGAIAGGPSRFLIEGMTWRLTNAPSSPPAA